MEKRGVECLRVYYYQEVIDNGGILYKGGIGKSIRFSECPGFLGIEVGMDLSILHLIYRIQDIEYLNGDCPEETGEFGGLILRLDDEEEEKFRRNLEETVEEVLNGRP